LPKLTLKIDADTYRGTRVGVPNLINQLRRLRAGATFLFSLGPDHTGWASSDLPSGLLQQGLAHLGGRALRPQDPDVRHPAAGTGHRQDMRRIHARARTPVSNAASTPGTTVSGRMTCALPTPNGR
jgi:hypothetical protein